MSNHSRRASDGSTSADDTGRRPEVPAGVGPMFNMLRGEARDSFLGGAAHDGNTFLEFSFLCFSAQVGQHGTVSENYNLKLHHYRVSVSTIPPSSPPPPPCQRRFQIDSAPFFSLPSFLLLRPVHVDLIVNSSLSRFFFQFGRL